MTLGLFCGVQLLAVAAGPGLAAGGVGYGDGGAALLPLGLGLAVGTGLALAVARYGVPTWVVGGLAVLSVGIGVWFVVAPLTGRLLATLARFGSLGSSGQPVGPFGQPVGSSGIGRGVVGPAVGGLAGVVAMVAVRRTRRQSVRNGLAMVGTAGVAAVFGASLSPQFAAVGLLLAAVYDAVAVYLAGTMQELAAVGQQHDLPTVFVVSEDGDEGATRSADARSTQPSSPLTTEAARPVEVSQPPGGDGAGGSRAMLVGTGDALFPAMFAASVRTHTAVVGTTGALPPGVGGASLGGLAPVVGPAVGSVVGLLVVQSLAARGGTHAGLPFIVSGTLVGWLLTG